MKKIYFIIISLFPFVALAQPTISQSDLPGAGLEIRMAIDSNYSGLVPPGGANQTWNYAAWSYDYVDTTGFISAAGTPFSASFPSANIASHNTSDNSWEYYISNSTGFYSNGSATQGLMLVINSGLLYVPVPFTYGGSRVHTGRVQIDTIISTIPFRSVINFRSTVSGDAWGTLTVPNNTYSNVLRLKNVQLQSDSILYDPSNTGNYIPAPIPGNPSQSQSTTYLFVSSGRPANLLAIIDADSLGVNASSSQYLLSYGTVSTNDLPEPPVGTVYPNPATSSLTITFGNGMGYTGQVEVYNSIGEVVKSVYLDNINTYRFPVSDLDNGIYFVKTLNDNYSRSFIVQH